MSAETLRRAAALMRERAEAAQPATGGPAWIVDHGNRYANSNEVFSGPEGRNSRDVATATDDDTAEYIASWHPAVALAVADWLDDMARWWDMSGLDLAPGQLSPNLRGALRVAIAYLPEES